MRNIKKLLSIVMVLTLVLALGASAFADGAGAASKVTIADDLAGHTFTAYQIFTGTQAADQDNELASVQWGADIDKDGFVAALKALGEQFNACDAAKPQTVVEALSKVASDSEMAEKIAEAAADNITGAGTEFTGSTELPNGYYLIKDTTEDLGGNNAYNDVVLQVTRNVEIRNKTDVPEVEKKVQDRNDTTGGANTGWQDSADWDINDDVPFQITGTLPTNLDEYETYKLVFHDVQSKGLTLNNDFVVTVGGVEATVGVDYTVNTAPGDGCTFEIVFNDITDVEGAANSAQVVVGYTAKLNENAEIGYTGNPNEVTMEFSNNAHGDGTGTTPKDKVIVFTYEMDANKVDGDNEALAGAGFTLLKKVAGAGDVTLGTAPNQKTYNGYVIMKQYKVEDDPNKTAFEFKGLDDGEYILVESEVPDGYNKADDIEFTISAEHEEDSADPKLLSFTSTGDVEASETSESGTDITGKITTDVQNLSGVTLPETGGIGTTIFYVVGGVLVAAAIILLVTKRRVSGAK